MSTELRFRRAASRPTQMKLIAIKRSSAEIEKSWVAFIFLLRLNEIRPYRLPLIKTVEPERALIFKHGVRSRAMGDA